MWHLGIIPVIEIPGMIPLQTWLPVPSFRALINKCGWHCLESILIQFCRSSLWNPMTMNPLTNTNQDHLIPGEAWIETSFREFEEAHQLRSWPWKCGMHILKLWPWPANFYWRLLAATKTVHAFRKLSIGRSLPNQSLPLWHVPLCLPEHGWIGPVVAKFWMQKLKPPNMPNLLTRPLRSSKDFCDSCVAAVIGSVKFKRDQNTVFQRVS